MAKVEPPPPFETIPTTWTLRTIDRETAISFPPPPPLPTRKTHTATTRNKRVCYTTHLRNSSSSSTSAASQVVSLASSVIPFIVVNVHLYWNRSHRSFAGRSCVLWVVTPSSSRLTRLMQLHLSNVSMRIPMGKQVAINPHFLYDHKNLISRSVGRQKRHQTANLLHPSPHLDLMWR